jgi:hypothetical protein
LQLARIANLLQGPQEAIKALIIAEIAKAIYEIHKVDDETSEEQNGDRKRNELSSLSPKIKMNCNPLEQNLLSGLVDPGNRTILQD